MRRFTTYSQISRASFSSHPGTQVVVSSPSKHRSSHRTSATVGPFPPDLGEHIAPGPREDGGSVLVAVFELAACCWIEPAGGGGEMGSTQCSVLCLQIGRRRGGGH